MNLNDPTDAARLALACLDLTSLNEGDDDSAIDALCAKAVGAPGRGAVAAVCVWPRFVARARAALPLSIRVAAVANFPAGDLDLGLALGDAQAVLAAGGDEVDLVLPWRALRGGRHSDAAGLVRAVRDACVGKTLKLIIESGELDVAEIDRACAIGLDAGVDMLKTSTGKTAHGASPEAARRMLAAIAAHPRAAQVGFKASGGVRSVADALGYARLLRQALGQAALGPARLRFGASGLLADIEARLGLGAAAPHLPDARY